MALASVAPPSTVVRTPVSVFWKVWFSWLAARISRHCTRGRPASIMTENWRKKIAMSLVLTLLEPKVGMENSLPFSRIAPGVMRSRRNCCSQRLFVGGHPFAAELSRPDAFFPENVKTGMVSLSSLTYLLVDSSRAILASCPASASVLRRCSRSSLPGVQPSPSRRS